MSWSITFIGKADHIANALKEQSAKLQGPSKVEYDAALPHLVGLVEQNFNNAGSPVLQITANGHGHDTYRQCTVSIQFLAGLLV